MLAFLLLCDAASTDKGSGKVNMLGAGWSITGPDPSAAAIAGFLRVPWDDVEDRVRFTLRLLDAKGEAVRPFVDNDDAVSFSGEFAVPPPDGLDEAILKLPLNIGFTIPLPPLPLQPGSTYTWVLESDGVGVASTDFAVRSKP